MNAERYRHLERLFLEARALPTDRRATFLACVARDRPDLHADLVLLLDHDAAPAGSAGSLEHGSGARVLAGALSPPPESSACDPGGARDLPTDHPRAIPTHLGRYRIIRVIGEGGMGTIYEAEQDDPRRRVALKVIRGGFPSPHVLERFRREAQMLGKLRHRGIAQIFDAHTAPEPGGSPYFVMELVDGPPLLRFAESARLTVPQRLDLIAEVCDALEHAHRSGLVHRDLKPGNILVQRRPNSAGDSGTPTFDSLEARIGGQPKILDFGVAHSSELNTLTEAQPGRLIGTVQYMSPEQAAGQPLDSRSDIYSVGVILFELLAGRLPYDLDGRMIHEAARIIRDEDPARLGAIDRRLRGDIEVIAAKALEKDRERRYASAADLAADIRRFLNDQPILARPPSSLYRLRKLAQRNRPIAVGVALAALAVAIAGLVSVGQMRAARLADTESGRQRALAETEAWRQYAGAIAGAAVAIDNYRPDSAAGFLAAADRGRNSWEHRHVALRIAAYTGKLEEPAPIAGAAFDPASGALITAGSDGALRWSDLSTGSVLRTVALPEPITGPAAFSRDCRRLVAVVGPTANDLVILDCRDGAEVVRLSRADLLETLRVEPARRNLPRPITAVAICPAGRRVALCAGGGVLWVPEQDARWSWLFSLQCTSLEFNDDGTRLVCGYIAPAVENFSLISALNALRTQPDDHDIPMATIEPPNWTVDPSVKRFIGDGDHRVRLYLFETGQKSRAFGESTLRISAIAFDPQTPRIAIATVDELIRVYDGRSRRLLRTLAGPGGEVTVLTFFEDGLRMLACAGRRVRTYQLSPIDARAGLGDLDAPISTISIADDGQIVAAGTSDRACAWRLDQRRSVPVRLTHDDGATSAAACAASELLAVGHRDGALTLHDLRAGKGDPPGRIDIGAAEPVTGLAFAPGGERIMGRTASALFVCDPAGGTTIWRTAPEGLSGDGPIAWSIDSSLVAAADSVRLRVWNAAAGEEVTAVLLTDGAVRSLAFAPDARTLAGGMDDGSIRVWDLRGGAVRTLVGAHRAEVRSLAFIPDGSRLASGSADRAIVLWDIARAEPVLTLAGHTGGVLALAFSPDGNRLVSGSADRSLRIWDAEAASAEPAP